MNCIRPFILSLIVGLILTVQSFAQISIVAKDRIENFDPGYCAWCSIEMLGRHHKVTKLYDLAKNRSKETTPLWNGTKWVQEPYVIVEHTRGQWFQEKRNVGSDYGIYRKLNSLGVKYYMQWTGNYSHKLITYAMKNKLGCCFSVKAGTFGPTSAPHAVVLTDFNDKTVEIVDPNDIGYTYTYDRRWFDTYWTGWVLIIEKEK